MKNAKTATQLWVEKYRPSSFDEYIFQDEGDKKAIMKMVEDQSIPHLLLSGCQGSGKAQPMDSLISTPKDGWVAMKNIKPGMEVHTPYGTTTKVLSIHPQGVRPVYELRTTDGGIARCSDDHLWFISIKKEDGTYATDTINTLEIQRLLEERPADELFIQAAYPVEYETATKFDHDAAVDMLIRELQTSELRYSVLPVEFEETADNIITSSINDRLMLMKAIIEYNSASMIHEPVTLSVMSEPVAKFLMMLSWSLSVPCSLMTSDVVLSNITRDFCTVYQIDFPSWEDIEQHASSNYRDAESTRWLRQIECVAFQEMSEVQCIYVEDEHHLYLTDDYLATHNTTLAKLLINGMELDPSDVMVINASDQRGIETFRAVIKNFALSAAIGKFKIVLLEEADSLTPAAQNALRQFTEEISEHVRFIMTCNHVNKIIPPLQSRCQHYRFNASDKNDITEYIVNILVAEQVAVDLDVIDEYVEAGYPDVRKIVNMVQQYTADGVLAPLVNNDVAFDYQNTLIDLINKGNWTAARKLICTNTDPDSLVSVYRFLYENIGDITKFKDDQAKWEEAIITISDGLSRHGLIADPEINMAATIIKLSQI